jgi:hypothetical protein
MEMEPRENIHSQKNANLRFEFLDKLDHREKAALGSFFRRIGLPHVPEESIYPSLGEGNTLLGVAVADRAWPPWGIGAFQFAAVVHVHPIGEEEASISNVFVPDSDLTNIGLLSALFKETLQELIKRGKTEIRYVVVENAVFSDRVLISVGFRRSAERFLTEHARYSLYVANAQSLLQKLGLADIQTSDLLSHNIEDPVFERNALFQSMTQLASRAYWSERSLISEIVAHTGIAVAASPPGGVGGTAGPIRRFDEEIEIESESSL